MVDSMMQSNPAGAIAAMDPSVAQQMVKSPTTEQDMAMLDETEPNTAEKV